MYVLNAAAEVYLMSSRQFKIALRDVNKKKNTEGVVAFS
jgi:hypothetical protein